ncbi:hypothetical protein CBW56_05425 [Denitratisoma oestradiolicum]|nr:hypothetical protein CBW56_05425 [Denitratisoma oestradiolicum]
MVPVHGGRHLGAGRRPGRADRLGRPGPGGPGGDHHGGVAAPDRRHPGTGELCAFAGQRRLLRRHGGLCPWCDPDGGAGSHREA